MSVFFWAPRWLLLIQLTDYNISSWALHGMHGKQSNNLCILLIKQKDKWHDQTKPKVCPWSLTGCRNAGGKDQSHKVGETLLSFALFFCRPSNSLLNVEQHDCLWPLSKRHLHHLIDMLPSTHRQSLMVNTLGRLRLCESCFSFWLNSYQASTATKARNVVWHW